MFESQPTQGVARRQWPKAFIDQHFPLPKHCERCLSKRVALVDDDIQPYRGGGNHCKHCRANLDGPQGGGRKIRTLRGNLF